MISLALWVLGRSRLVKPERPNGRVLLGTEIGEWNESAV